MKSISIKLPEGLLATTIEFASAFHIPRAEYIRRARARLNQETQALARARRLAEASYLVRDETMRVNAEFAATEHAPEPEERGTRTLSRATIWRTYRAPADESQESWTPDTRASC